VALQSTSTGWLCTMRTQEERNSLREQEGTAVHLKDLLSFEKADDLVEKWSSLDETLQESPSISNFELPSQIEGSEEYKTGSDYTEIV